MEWGRDAAAPGDEVRAGIGVYGLHRRGAEQPAELHRVPDLHARSRDQAHRRRLLVYHADGRLVRDDGGDGRGGGIAGDRDHVQSHGADAGHGFQLIQAQGALLGILFSGAQSGKLIGRLERDLKTMIFDACPQYREDPAAGILFSYGVYGGYYALTSNRDCSEDEILEIIGEAAQRIAGMLRQP